MVGANGEFSTKEIMLVMLYKKSYCQQFLVRHAVIPFSFRECLTSIGYDSLASVLDLREHRSYADIASISVQIILPFFFGVAHYLRAEEDILQGLKSMLAL